MVCVYQLKRCILKREPGGVKRAQNGKTRNSTNRPFAKVTAAAFIPDAVSGKSDSSEAGRIFPFFPPFTTAAVQIRLKSVLLGRTVPHIKRLHVQSPPCDISTAMVHVGEKIHTIKPSAQTGQRVSINVRVHQRTCPFMCVSIFVCAVPIVSFPRHDYVSYKFYR